jgi:hypothetical protein
VAALANRTGARGDEFVHREDRIRGRPALRVVDGRSQRSAAARVRAAAPLDPLIALDLDFGAAPTVLFAGEAMPEARANVYARLIAGGAIAALHPHPDESAVAFLNRSVATVDAGAAFRIQFGEHDGNGSALTALGPERLIVSFEGGSDRTMHCDIAAFDATLCAHDPALAGVLVRAIETNASALNAIGPSYAWDLVRNDRFDDDIETWWEEQRAEVEYEQRSALGKKGAKAKIAVTNADVRKHLRERGITTPGALRNELGRHYCMPRAMMRHEIDARIAALPEPARTGALAVHAIATRMKRRTAA